MKIQFVIRLLCLNTKTSMIGMDCFVNSGNKKPFFFSIVIKEMPKKSQKKNIFLHVGFLPKTFHSTVVSYVTFWWDENVAVIWGVVIGCIGDIIFKHHTQKNTLINIFVLNTFNACNMK